MKKLDKTNAIRILEQHNINFDVLDYTSTNAVNGMEVANALNENPDEVFKTLVTQGKSKNYYVFLVPVNRELDLKKCAIAVNEKNIEMIKSKDLLPLTGYIHGGCSPIGMKKQFKTVIDETVILNDRIIFSGGKIGYQIVTTLEELQKVIPIELKDIS